MCVGEERFLTLGTGGGRARCSGAIGRHDPATSCRIGQGRLRYGAILQQKNEQIRPLGGNNCLDSCCGCVGEKPVLPVTTTPGTLPCWTARLRVDTFLKQKTGQIRPLEGNNLMYSCCGRVRECKQDRGVNMALRCISTLEVDKWIMDWQGAGEGLEGPGVEDRGERYSGWRRWHVYNPHGVPGGHVARRR